MTAGLPLMKNVLSAGMSAVDAEIRKNIYGPSTTALLISTEKMEDIMKIVQPLEKSRILIKRISEVIKNEAKEPKRGYLSILFGTLAVSTLRNALTGRGVIRAGVEAVRAGENFE